MYFCSTFWVTETLTAHSILLLTISYTSVGLTYLDNTSLSYLQLQKTNVVTKASHYSSTLVKPNLTSEEKHVNDSNPALFYNVFSWTRSLIFTGTAPEVQPKNPFQYQHDKECVQFTAQELLHFFEKMSSRLLMKNISISEILVPVMSRLFD